MNLLLQKSLLAAVLALLLPLALIKLIWAILADEYHQIRSDP
ncbi:MAG: hypothetical protein AseanaTS_15820 [Candidatus Pelagadaptatus aseana]